MPTENKPAAQHQGESAACNHEWTDDGEFLLVCTACGTQEDYTQALQLAFELGGTDDGSYHLEAEELCEVIRRYVEHPAPVAVVATPPSTGSGTMKLIELIADRITIWPADAYCFAQDCDGYCFSFKKEPLANGGCWDGRVASETFLAERCVDSATTFVTRQQWEAYRLGFKQKSEQPAPVAVVMSERSNHDYAIEHAEYMAQAADDVLAKFQAYGLTLLAVDEGGDDGEGELFEAIDTARSDLQESLVDLRGMVYEFRKRSNRCTSL